MKTEEKNKHYVAHRGSVVGISAVTMVTQDGLSLYVGVYYPLPKGQLVFSESNFRATPDAYLNAGLACMAAQILVNKHMKLGRCLRKDAAFKL